MATISTDTECLTLINTFHVSKDRAAELADMLTEATRQTMRHFDGFISASIHIRKERDQVVNYAQWRDKAAMDAMAKNPDARVHMEKCAKIADRYTPVLFDVVSSESGS